MRDKLWTDCDEKERAVLMRKCQDADEFMEHMTDHQLHRFMTRYCNLGVPIAHAVNCGFCLPNAGAQEWVNTILAVKIAIENGTLTKTKFGADGSVVNITFPGEECYKLVAERYGDVEWYCGG